MGFPGVDIPELGPQTKGKVRDIYHQGDEIILITTDRLSAFDQILGEVPYKGQVLNQLSLWWFDQLADIVPNYVTATPHPYVVCGHACAPLPIEVIVRGYISGETKTALWYRYAQGEREIYGHSFPDGLTKNAALPEPIITPTTKGAPGQPDERLTLDEVTSQGHLTPDLWAQVQEVALAVFAKGQERAAEAGLILVDTKYEFGLLDGQLVIIDEVHTPDSSRFWDAATYAQRIAEGAEPDNMDKEFIRLWYAAQGYRGQGTPPAFSQDLAQQASARYISVYERLTGQTFAPANLPCQEDIRHALLARYR